MTPRAYSPSRVSPQPGFVTPYPTRRVPRTPPVRVHARRRAARPDLLEPHILRSLSNIKVVSIHASCCGCHCVVLDVDGVAWLFGRNDKSCLGVAGVDAISENAPRRLVPQELGAPKSTRFVHAALGRNHTLLVGSDGQLWSAGANHAGQVSSSRSGRGSLFSKRLLWLFFPFLLRCRRPWCSADIQRVLKSSHSNSSMVPSSMVPRRRLSRPLRVLLSR